MMSNTTARPAAIATNAAMIATLFFACFALPNSDVNEDRCQGERMADVDARQVISSWRNRR
jgi:hypothetical protein